MATAKTRGMFGNIYFKLLFYSPRILSRTKLWSYVRARDFLWSSLMFETETSNFETETETQMKVVETITDEASQMCLRLECLMLRLLKTQNLKVC